MCECGAAGINLMIPRKHDASARKANLLPNCVHVVMCVLARLAWKKETSNHIRVNKFNTSTATICIQCIKSYECMASHWICVYANNVCVCVWKRERLYPPRNTHTHTHAYIHRIYTHKYYLMRVCDIPLDLANIFLLPLMMIRMVRLHWSTHSLTYMYNMRKYNIDFDVFSTCAWIMSKKTTVSIFWIIIHPEWNIYSMFPCTEISFKKIKLNALQFHLFLLWKLKIAQIFIYRFPTSSFRSLRVDAPFIYWLNVWMVEWFFSSSNIVSLHIRIKVEHMYVFFWSHNVI